MFAAFSAKNIPVVVAVMISPSLIESSMFFFQSKLLIYCVGFFYHQIQGICQGYPIYKRCRYK